ncbi:MAG: alpha/beta fold hydrolase [Candidatus Eremiobacteraeota bacterium]|nr:alpha/beta fold hydrolase [Candidatus Eremiobacteraeota bacterium]
MIQLFFIHGAGCTADVFQSQLAEFRTAQATTLPGHGTGSPGSPETVKQFADAVAKELSGRPERSVVLCGSSMGGAIALELGLRKHRSIRALALIGSGAKLRVAPTVFTALEDDFQSATRLLATRFFADPTPERVAAAADAMQRVGQTQTLRDFRACDAFDVTERISALSVPLLAIAGEQDVLTPPKFSHWLTDRVRGAAARILPGAGHLAMVERPAETNAALRAFVDRVDSE